MDAQTIEALKKQADTIEEAIAAQLQTTIEHVEGMKNIVEIAATRARDSVAALGNALAMLKSLREKIDAL